MLVQNNFIVIKERISCFYSDLYFTFFEEKNENPLSTSGKTITDSRILQIHTNVQQFHKLQIPFFFSCALFLPCIPPLKSHWCSGSAPSQAGKPMLVLQCPLPQILCLHRVIWTPSLAGLTLIFPYLSLFSSSHQQMLFCCIP